MKNELRCLFPNVHRITADYNSRSIFKSCLGKQPHELLRQVADTRVQHLSPFDAAAVINSLLESAGRRGGAQIRRNPLYRTVATKLVEGIERYRQELLFYFIERFFKLHDVQAIKSLSRAFVERNAAAAQNAAQIVELLYCLAHHAPKELTRDAHQQAHVASQNASSHCRGDEEHVQVYLQFVQQLQRELVTKAHAVRDRVLLYKLVTALAVLPRTQHTEAVLNAVTAHVRAALERNSWESKHLPKLLRSLKTLEAIDDDMLNRIIRVLELNQDNLESGDVRAVLELLEPFGIQWVADDQWLNETQVKRNIPIATR